MALRQGARKSGTVSSDSDLEALMGVIGHLDVAGISHFIRLSSTLSAAKGRQSSRKNRRIVAFASHVTTSPDSSMSKPRLTTAGWRGTWLPVVFGCYVTPTPGAESAPKHGNLYSSR